jgi:hypothetical protein
MFAKSHFFWPFSKLVQKTLATMYGIVYTQLKFGNEYRTGEQNGRKERTVDH